MSRSSRNELAGSKIMEGQFDMTLAELVAGVQFTVNQEGQMIAVVIDPSLWQRIMDALEDAEDRELVQALQARLVGGPAAGGALRWQDIADQWT